MSEKKVYVRKALMKAVRAALPKDKTGWGEIANPLHCGGTGNILGAADELLDLQRGQFQDEINAAVKAKLDKLPENLDGYQPKLTAGTGIAIENGVIRSTLDLTLFRLVAELPDVNGADASKIYLVQDSGGNAGDKNVYMEYIVVASGNPAVKGWEKLGQYRSSVDLTGYMKTADADAKYQKKWNAFAARVSDRGDNLPNKNGAIIAGCKIQYEDPTSQSTPKPKIYAGLELFADDQDSGLYWRSAQYIGGAYDAWHQVLTTDRIANASMDMSGKKWDQYVVSYQRFYDSVITKANAADVYKKSAVDAKVSSLQPKLTAGTGIAIDNGVIRSTLDLTLFKLVTALPDVNGADFSKIYLVPDAKGNAGDKNVYAEYIVVASGDPVVKSWEKLGTFQSSVDLTGYLKTADADAKYLAKANLATSSLDMNGKDGDAYAVSFKRYNDYKSASDADFKKLYGIVFANHAWASIKVASGLTNGVIEKGVTTAVNISWGFGVNGATGDDAAPTSVKVLKNDAEWVADGKAATSKGDSLTDGCAYKVVAAFAHGATKEATVGITARYPIYVVCSAKEALASADIVAADGDNHKKYLMNNPGNGTQVTVKNAADAQYIWVCVPADMEITKMMMGGQPMTYKDAVGVAVDGKGTYRAYRSFYSQDAGQKTFQIWGGNTGATPPPPQNKLYTLQVANTSTTNKEVPKVAVTGLLDETGKNVGTFVDDVTVEITYDLYNHFDNDEFANDVKVTGQKASLSLKKGAAVGGSFTIGAGAGDAVVVTGVTVTRGASATVDYKGQITSAKGQVNIVIVEKDLTKNGGATEASLSANSDSPAGAVSCNIAGSRTLGQAVKVVGSVTFNPGAAPGSKARCVLKSEGSDPDEDPVGVSNYNVGCMSTKDTVFVMG